MFDLNTILTQALTAAVAEATKPLVERIEKLETNCNAYEIMFRSHIERLEALENNPATGETLSPDDLVQVKQRIEVLENTSFAPINEARLVEVLDQQEWFWEKLMRKAGEAAESAVEEAINDHCSTYDHDDYDNTSSAVNDVDLDDLVSRGDLEDAINSALHNATITIRI